MCLDMHDYIQTKFYFPKRKTTLLSKIHNYHQFHIRKWLRFYTKNPETPKHYIVTNKCPFKFIQKRNYMLTKLYNITQTR